MKNIITLSILGASLAAVGVVQAETLDVNASVVPFCSISLNQVSSGTLSSAEEDAQTIANLDLKCNAASGAVLSVTPANGDLVGADNNKINYAMSLNVNTVDSLDIDPTDTVPGNTPIVRTQTGFHGDLASEVQAVFKMDVNVEAPGPYVLGQELFPARSAPAGSYVETFTFELSAV